ncbi:MAG: hypothetical protein AAF616_13905 [Bacteroidota bacterium]
MDTASTSKYRIAKSTQQSKVSATESQTEAAPQEEMSFGDRALSIGSGILNRLKTRFNLDEAAESIKEKKEKLLGAEGKSKDG